MSQSRPQMSKICLNVQLLHPVIKNAARVYPASLLTVESVFILKGVEFQETTVSYMEVRDRNHFK